MKAAEEAGTFEYEPERTADDDDDEEEEATSPATEDKVTFHMSVKPLLGEPYAI